MDVLLNRGSNPHLLDGQKRTCLHHAASFGCPKMIDRLLKEGLYRKTGDINGWTPLDWATRAGNLTNFKILSETVAGAIGLLKPRRIAIYHGHVSLASHLETVIRISPEHVLGDLPTASFPTKELLHNDGTEHVPSGIVEKSVENEDLGAQDLRSGNIESEFDSSGMELKNLLNSQSQAMPAPKHLGVWCDGCDLPICGPRHKCSVCVDFNYCFKCIASSKYNHPSHGFELMAVEEATPFNVQLGLNVMLKRKMRRITPIDWLKEGADLKRRASSPPAK